jgi:DNA-binding transcriptional MerR regulator
LAGNAASVLDPGPGICTIGDLATEFTLSPRAIRFYEDAGLLNPARAGTTRIYTYRDRARLKLILRGKRLGFSLAAIKTFVDLYDADRTQQRQLAATLDGVRNRIAELEQQLADLTLTLAELRDIETEIIAFQQAAGHPPLLARGSAGLASAGTRSGKDVEP